MYLRATVHGHIQACTYVVFRVLSSARAKSQSTTIFFFILKTTILCNIVWMEGWQHSCTGVYIGIHALAYSDVKKGPAYFPAPPRRASGKKLVDHGPRSACIAVALA